ncbi:MAG: glycosyltransferase family 4 protein [Clostridiales bacterium]|nr:glycosyltransferase family 4 protein [Clostridiales bacterium]
MKKRILIVCQHFWPENFRINDIAKNFVEHGYEVDALCGIPNYPKGEFFSGYGFFRRRHEEYEGIRIFRCGEVPRKGNTYFRIFLNYISFPFFSLFHVFPRLFTHYDVVFLYQLSPVIMVWAGMLIAKIKKLPTVMYVLDLWPDNLYSVLDIKNKFLRKIAVTMSHWHYRHASRLIAISPRMQKKLYDITENKSIITVPQFCEKIYETTIYDESLNDRFKNGFNIVYAGNISPAQNYSLIAKTAKILVDDYGIKDINWIIVGDGMSKNDFERIIADYALEDIFYFEGMHPMEDIPKYAYIADGLLAALTKTPGLDCTIPARVISYFAAGKPLLLSMDGDATDLVNGQNCGFASAAGDVEQFAENICKLYRMNDSERTKMGDNAKKVYMENFERGDCLARLIAFIQP